jgi:hypothetical protein
MIEKSRNPFLTYSICQKINYIEIRKQNKVILSIGNAHRVLYRQLNIEFRSERFLFCTLPASRKRFTRRDIVDLFGTGESGNVSLNSFCKLSKNEMPGSVRQ